MSQLRKSLDDRYPRHVVLTAGALAGLFEIGYPIIVPNCSDILRCRGDHLHVCRRTTYPLDTIKTKMQLNPRMYTSAWQVCRGPLDFCTPCSHIVPAWQAGKDIVVKTGPASLLYGK